jgi:hypothetical protein
MNEDKSEDTNRELIDPTAQAPATEDLSPVQETIEHAANAYYRFCRKAARMVTRFKRRYGDGED